MKSYVDSTWGYVWVKVPEDLKSVFVYRWMRKHHLVWFRRTGARVPRGYLLHHKDGNKENNKFRNLELMTWSQHAREHRVGYKHSSETRKKMSLAAKRVAEDPAERRKRSLRAKKQHKEKNFGRWTWRADAA